MKMLKILVVCVCIIFCSHYAYALFCPQCGSGNPEGAKFCVSCGKAIPGGKGKAIASAPAIKGNVYITLNSGQSIIQRGLQISLIKASDEVANGLAKIGSIENEILKHNVAVINKAQSQSYADYHEMLGSLSAGVALIERHANEVYKYFNSVASQSTRTDINGACEFDKLTDGGYYIFAQYKTNIENGYWLVKVSAGKGEPTTLELSNFNLTSQ